MRLSDLTAFVEEKYHILEQHKWANFPGVSVLVDPNTQKWVALLMRGWDAELGEEIELCDLKCGMESLSGSYNSFISPPFRMRGKNWLGVRFNGNTEKDIVYRLFDKAMSAGEQRGFTIILGSEPAAQQTQNRETPIPFGKAPASEKNALLPEKIREMMSLYTYGDGSFRQKCRNFYIQGKCMADYEDNAPWNGAFHRYFTTYHDLSIKQLRGYFTWRTKLRKGIYEPVSTSLAYLYVYELLNGIGADSTEDALLKMREFETEFLDSGIGDGSMRKNLRRWMLELAVTSGLAPEIGRQYADIDGLKRDAAMLVLRQPAEHDDDAVFEALCAAGGSRIPSSAIFKKDENQGKRLFSAVWRHAAASVEKDGKDFFTACFGTQKEFNWHPLGNAVYWNRRPTANADYILNKCHRFICRNGIWKERSYRSLYYNRPLFEGLLRETDRLSRMYLKTGHPLKERQEDAWASPIVEDVIAQAQKAKIEAAQQKIAIRFENLHLIRRAALQTRESLLTEEEKAAETKGAPPITEAATGDAPHDGILSVPLTAEQVQVLTMLLNGESVRKTLQSWNEMAEVFADSLNEALFNEIGDTAVACDGVDILLVEDYREDMIRILGGTKR